MAWWVLNIAIVLIAVTAFSRRQSKPGKKGEDDED
jgi:cbb3-type cytochrome oxidase subunit 3